VRCVPSAALSRSIRVISSERAAACSRELVAIGFGATRALGSGGEARFDLGGFHLPADPLFARRFLLRLEVGQSGALRRQLLGRADPLDLALLQLDMDPRPVVVSTSARRLVRRSTCVVDSSAWRRA